MKKFVTVCIAAILTIVVMAFPTLSVTRVEHQINHARTAHRLSHLRAKPFLEGCAKQEARWIAQHSLQHFHANADCYNRTWGEVIGEAPDVDSIVHAWMASPEHRVIILSRSYHKFGCARDQIGDKGVFAYACEFRG